MAKRREKLNPSIAFGIEKTSEARVFGVVKNNNISKRIIAVIFVATATLISSLCIFNALNTNAAAPVVSTIEPDNGPIAGGTVITVTGTGFKGQYERVEALEFSGGAYIDTDVIQRNHYINARFQMMTTDTSTANTVFGTNSATAVDRYSYSRVSGSGGAYTAYYGATAATSTSSLVKVNQRNDLTLDWTTSNNLHINGTTQSTGTGTNLPSNNAYIRIGGDANLNSTYRGYIYSLRTYSGTTMNHNFIPVKKVKQNISDPDEYGVVDTFTGTFYGNSAGVGTIIGGSWEETNFIAGKIISGSLSPDRQIEVLIDGRTCTGVNIVSNTELTCHTPSGLSLGQKDVIVRDSLNPSDSVTVANGYEYALRLNSVLPKFGDPGETTEIEIDGGVFSTPPEQYDSVDGLVFDGNSWIETGFDQLGDTKTVITYKYASSLPTSNMGLYGSRSSASYNSNVIWATVSGTSVRSDFSFDSSAGGAASSFSSNGMLNGTYTIIKDNGYTDVYKVESDNSLTWRVSLGATTGIQPLNGASVQMLLGSLSHGGAYGTSGTSVYNSFMGTIYGTQICKALNAIPAGTVYQQDDATCGSNRVLVRDFRPAVRDTDGAYGFYDMVTGAFFENAGFGTFRPETITAENDLEVPLELRVNFTYLDANDIEQTGVCANPKQVVVNETTGELSPTKIRCTMPISPLPEDGQGKVDLTVYANDVEATSGTADANDFYYGSPMVVETISPNRGPIAGWQTVTITGNNFHPSLNSVPTFDPETDWPNILITIGGSVCNFELDSEDPTKLADTDHYTNTSITCMTTANAGGISDIEVTLNYFDEIDQEPKTTSYLYGGALDPITGAITSGYLYEGDLISISPNIGPTTGGTVVTITGSGFVTDPGITTQIFFGNVAASSANIAVISSTEIRVTTPRSATTGVKNVTVVQTGQTGYAASFTSNPEDGFEYEFVTGTGTLTPNQAYTTGGDTVLLTGTFDSQASTVVTLTSGTGQNQVITTLDPQDINVLSDTQIEIIMPLHLAGVVLVTVNQHNTDIPIANLTYVLPLTITNITPDVGPVGGGTIVTITGTSFVPIGGNAMAILLSGKLDVTIGGESCAVAMFTQYTNTSIICTTSARVDGISGLYDVVVAVDTSEATEEDPDPLPIINPNHTGTLVNGFRYVELGLSLGSQLVNLGTISGSSPLGTGSTLVDIQTNNPNGYIVTIRADDSDGETSNDNWLKCSTNSTYKFNSIANQGALTDDTWGWNIGDVAPITAPSTYRPILTTNSTFVDSPNSSLNNGADPDTYRLWFGAKTSATQPPCTYRSIVLLTAVANS